MKKNPSKTVNILQGFMNDFDASNSGNVMLTDLQAVLKKKDEQDRERRAEQLLVRINGFQSRFNAKLADLRSIREKERQAHARVKNLSSALEKFQKNGNLDELETAFKEHENKIYKFKS